MLRTVVCLAFVSLVLISAVEEDHIADAHETIKLMKSQGADTNACKDLATSSIKDVNNTFDSNQAQLNALSTGSECVPNADISAGVPAAQKAVDDATAAQTTAQANLDAAKNVVPEIQTPSVYALSLISGKTCDWAYSTSYQTANAAMTGAQTTLTKATAAVTATKSALSNAKDTSARQAHTCQCNAVGASDNAWATVSAAGPANDRATSWTKSQNILCALSGTSPCTFPSVPVATRPSLAPEITPTVVTQCRAEIIAAEQADKVEKANKETSSKESTAKNTKNLHWARQANAQLSGTDQSSGYSNYQFPASKAVDGNNDNNFGGNSCTHTESNQNAWWRANLVRPMEIQRVLITNRGDCCGGRLNPFDIRISMNGELASAASCYAGTYGSYGGNYDKYSMNQGESRWFDCANSNRDSVTLAPKGQYVYIVLGRNDYLHLCEVNIQAYDAAMYPGQP